MSITDPHHTASQPGNAPASNLCNPFYRQMRFSLLTFLGLAAVVICLRFLGHSWSKEGSDNDSPVQQVFLLIEAFVGIAAVGFGVATPMMWLQARRTDRALDSLHNGHFYVRWEYRREFWQAWVKWQTARLGNSLGMILIVLLAAIPITMLAMHWYADANHLNASARRAQGIVLVPIAFFAAVMAVCWLLTKLKRNSSMRDAPFVAFISKTAVYLHGNVYLLTGGLGTFAEVKLVTGQPSRMEFRFRQTTQTGDRYFACAVPVPPGAEAVAEKVTAALRREYPSTIANSNG